MNFVSDAFSNLYQVWAVVADPNGTCVLSQCTETVNTDYQDKEQRGNLCKFSTHRCVVQATCNDLHSEITSVMVLDLLVHMIIMFCACTWDQFPEIIG